MEKKNKALAILSNLDVAISAIVLVALVVMTFMGVIWRRVFGAPFTWLEEVQLACMVWIVFSAGGAAFRYGNHVAIEMIMDILPQKLKRICELFISVVVVAVLAFLFYQSLGFISLFLRSGRSTPMLHIPYLYIYGIAPVSFVVMLISYFYALIKGVKSEAKEAVSGE